MKFLTAVFAVLAFSGVAQAQNKESTDLLLALSWQPAFCEIKPDSRECKLINSGKLEHTSQQLSLHGLWPQPKGNDFCQGVSKPRMDKDTLERLAYAMPGMFSGLHTYQWRKHGTCFYGSRNGDEYYDDTLRVMKVINESSIVDLFTERMGSDKPLTIKEIRQRFDEVFGKGAGRNVVMTCNDDGNRKLVGEIRVALVGEITPRTTTVEAVGKMIKDANLRRGSCKSGLVDKPGLQ